MFITKNDLAFLKKLEKELYGEEGITSRVLTLGNMIHRLESNHRTTKERQRVQMQQRRAIDKNYGRKKVAKNVES